MKPRKIPHVVCPHCGKDYGVNYHDAMNKPGQRCTNRYPHAYVRCEGILRAKLKTSD